MRFGQLAQFARLSEISGSRDHGICITFKRQQIFNRRKPLFTPEVQAYMPLIAKQGKRRRLVRQQRRISPDAVAVDVDALGTHQLCRHLGGYVGDSGLVLPEYEKEPDIGTSADCAYETAFFCAAHSPRA